MMEKIPLQFIVAEMAGTTTEKLLKWNKQDWLNFADELRQNRKEPINKNGEQRKDQ